MPVIATLVGILLIFSALWDAFETIVLPRRVIRRLRITRLVYRVSWGMWSRIARRVKPRRHEAFLSYYGPLVVLFLLVTWAVVLVVGFAMLQWAFGSSLVASGGGHASFGTDLY